MFIIEDTIVKPTPESLMVTVFKNIWEKDKSSRKEIALKNLALVEFFVSPKKSNPFYGYDKADRKEKILKAISLDVKDIYKKEVDEAILFYEDYIKECSPSLTYYNSAIEAANKMKGFFSTFSLSERTKSGTPVYKPGDITKALQDTDKVLNTLNTLRQKVEQDIYENFKTKSNRDINPFETGEDI